MGKAQRRRGNTSMNKQYGKARRTRNHEHMIDQIVNEDMLPEMTEKLLNQAANEDLPGLGQHYCVTCAKHFISDAAIKEHNAGKQHKKRLRVCLTEVPYSIEESERAAGLQPAKKLTVTVN